MIIFLSGDTQIGKTTVIERTLEILNMTPGGFRTYFGPDRASSDRCLYMNSASEQKSYDPDKIIVKFFKDEPPEVRTHLFDTIGVGLIRSARIDSSLILMDECGSLERDALLFQKEILETLDNNLPILGVIKQDSYGWTDRIRKHPHVLLLTVTKENRDILPSILADTLSEPK